MIGLGVAGLYMFPTRTPSQGDLYAGADERVLASLQAFRGDYPTRRVDVGGRLWTYLRVGEGPETVLFLHGLGGSYDIWWQQARALMDRYSVIALNHADDPTLGGAALAVQSVLDQEGVDRAHVVGTSMGGYLAQYLSAEAPDRVASLVLANTFAPGDWIEEQYGTYIRFLPVLPEWVPQRSFRQTIESSLFPASGGSQIVRSFLLEQSYRMERADFVARMSVLTESFSTPDLEALEIPAMIIEADNDPSVPESARTRLVETYPTLPVVTMSEVGHFPYLNRPAAYTRILEDFWTGLSPDSSSVGESARVGGTVTLADAAR